MGVICTQHVHILIRHLPLRAVVQPQHVPNKRINLIIRSNPVLEPELLKSLYPIQPLRVVPADLRL